MHSADVKLSQVQRRRLEWIGTRRNSPAASSGNDVEGTVVIMMEPPTAVNAEMLCRSLKPGSIVVIPYGERAGFDFLKSKLVEFGTVGCCAEGPHELWWGGTNWAPLLAQSGGADGPMRIVSCYPQAAGDSAALRLRNSALALGLVSDIQPIDTRAEDLVSAAEKTGFLLRMWNACSEPLLFVEPDAMLMAAPRLAHLGCDVALHKWKGWEFSPRTLYLGRSERSEALLRCWNSLAETFPAVAEGYLLDQAWSLTSSQQPLDTIWLPRPYHAVRGDAGADAPVIVHHLDGSADLGPDPDFGALVRSARRAARSGGGEPLIVLTSPRQSGRHLTVLLRDPEASDPRTVAGSIEALTSAFTSDPGEFDRFELVLCPWQEDARLATRAARAANHQVLEVTPRQTLPPDLFGALTRRQVRDDRRPIVRHDGERPNV